MKALIRAKCISRFHCRWSLRTENSMQVKMENSMQRINGVLVRMYLALISNRERLMFVFFLGLLGLLLHFYSMMFAVSNNNNNNNYYYYYYNYNDNNNNHNNNRFSKQLVHCWNLPWFTRMKGVVPDSFQFAMIGRPLKWHVWQTLQHILLCFSHEVNCLNLVQGQRLYLQVKSFYLPCATKRVNLPSIHHPPTLSEKRPTTSLR